MLLLGKDRGFCIVCATTGKEKQRIANAHRCVVYLIMIVFSNILNVDQLLLHVRSSPYALTVVDKNLVASGDDDGVLQVSQGLGVIRA